MINGMTKKAQRSANWGGRRDRAGRKPVLETRISITVNAEERHGEILDRYGVSVGATSRSEAFRLLLEQVDEEYEL